MISVDQTGTWHLYAQVLPNGAAPLGTVTIDGVTGALVRLPSGAYAQVVGDTVRRLDGRKIAAALGKAGRRPKMAGGVRINLYLDAATVEAARRLGSGNLSLGVRRAVAMAAQSNQPEKQ